jgi:hypothetical protein
MTLVKIILAVGRCSHHTCIGVKVKTWRIHERNEFIAKYYFALKSFAVVYEALGYA